MISRTFEALLIFVSLAYAQDNAEAADEEIVELGDIFDLCQPFKDSTLELFDCNEEWTECTAKNGDTSDEALAAAALVVKGGASYEFACATAIDIAIDTEVVCNDFKEAFPEDTSSDEFKTACPLPLPDRCFQTNSFFNTQNNETLKTDEAIVDTPLLASHEMINIGICYDATQILKVWTEWGEKDAETGVQVIEDSLIKSEHGALKTEDETCDTLELKGASVAALIVKGTEEKDGSDTITS